MKKCAIKNKTVFFCIKLNFETVLVVVKLKVSLVIYTTEQRTSLHFNAQKDYNLN